MTHSKESTQTSEPQRDPGLDREYKAISDELPTMSADSQILRAARESVSKPQRTWLPSNWLMPAGAFAVAALAASAVFLNPAARQQPRSEVALQAPSAIEKLETKAENRTQPASANALKNESREELAMEDRLLAPLEASPPRAAAALTVQTGHVADVASDSSVRARTIAPQKALRQADTMTSSIVAESGSENVADTLGLLLDEISDSDGNLDDRELDLLFPDQDSWLTSIRRLLTTGSHDRALQLETEFRERFPSDQMPQDLEKMLGKLRQESN